jgi:hypothetical protein
MQFVILALLSSAPNDLEKRVVNPVVGYSLVAGAKVGMTPDQIVNRIAWPDRIMQRPDPAGSMLHFQYDRYNVSIVWESRNKTAGGPAAVLRWAGKRIVAN